MTQVFLLSDGTTTQKYWPDPGDWNPVNKVECIGNGSNGGSGGGAVGGGGGGGGGGAYAVGNNLTLTFPVPYVTSPKGNIGLSNNPATNFNTTGAVNSTAPGCVSAMGGLGNSAGSGGGSAFFPAGFAGGSGRAQGAQASYGNGGGGAAGPHGAGSTGNYSDDVPHGKGGNADNGTVLGGQGAGASGTQFDATHGCGAGGAGSQNSTSPGNTGGQYGGGGGGGWDAPSGAARVGGAGGDGLIVITYTPFVAVTQARAVIIT